MATRDARSVGLVQNGTAHGTSGPIHFSYPPPVYSDQLEAWIPSMAAMGIASRDPASGLTADAFLASAAIDPNGYTRSYSKTGYLDPVATRSNLDVLTGFSATRINFNGTTATGVRYAAASGGTSYAVNARKEVILSSGTVGSPRASLFSSPVLI
jgi:choline dehydrogenase